MSKWNIYHKDNSLLTDVNDEDITIKGLEYSDSWMGECFLTTSIKNDAPINFEIGDFILYRGERFELNYDPGKEKQARKGSYGEGFVYDSIKFNALQDELARTEFLDVVLNDNQLHYTSMPKFQFYVETIDDLLDRIQANLNEQIGEGEWKIFSRSLRRSMQRGVTEDEWKVAYGDDETSAGDFDSQSITVDSQTCWQALALVNEKWDINFIIRNRCVYVGTAGVTTQNIFKYGLGNGLYEIDQNADSEQSIITRLRAYGSEKNLPEHYYADLGIKYKANITSVKNASNFVEFMLDLDYIDTYFKEPRKYKYDSSSQEQTYGWVLRVTFDYKTIVTGYVTKGSDGKCRFYSELKGSQYDNGDEESKEALDAFISQVKEGNTLLYISSGIDKKTIPYENKEYAKNLPNNMSINRLMLPGFPHLSLGEFYETLTDGEKKYVNPTGRDHVFSTDKYRPYIDSVNLEKIGLRSGSQFFDTEDKTNGVIDIYPTIEEMVIGGVRVDEIYTGTDVKDNGRFDDGQTVANVDIFLNPAIDFDINDLRDDDFSISMKDGMCAGRTFSVASASKIDGRWRLTIERVKDDALNLRFPYSDYQIKKGDHFVLTGIELPDSYIRAASLKLLKYAIALLDKNDYTRYVYQPKVDELFMARQHDKAMDDKTGTIKSLHDTLKAGDLMRFEDEDLGIDAEITIDQLTIKEEDGKIPTYEITLREDKEVGTIQKIQQQISSLESGNGGSGSGGATIAQVKSQIASEGGKYFLSKLTDDTAQGSITFEKLQHFLQGITLGANGRFGINQNGEALLSLIQSLDFNEAAQSGFSISKTDSGRYKMLISMIEVWGKAIFHELEVRKLSYVGGNFIFSPAGSRLVRVVPAYKVSVDGEITWTTKQPTAASTIDGWKCFLLADDGSTATTNMWKKGDQARCETFNIKSGVYENVSNRYYWRLVEEVSTENEQLTDEDGNILYDGMGFAWIILSASDHDTMSDDAPLADDTIVCMGNREDESRQNIIMISTDGEDAPSIVGYKHISGYYLNEENRNHIIFQFSSSQIILASNSLEYVGYDGSRFSQTIYRGEWSGSETYFQNDQVDHNGTLWQCTTGNAGGTKDEPSEDSTQWRAMTDVLHKRINIELNGQDTLDWGETIKVVCSVVRGDTEIDTSNGWNWSVERDSGNELEDASWNAGSKAQAFDGTISIAFTEQENDLGTELKGVYGTVFTFYAWEDNKKSEVVSATLSI